MLLEMQVEKSIVMLYVKESTQRHSISSLQSQRTASPNVYVAECN